MKKIRKKITAEMHGVREEIQKKTLGYIVTALGLVAGLAWNDAIKALIDYFFPLSAQGVWAKILYAVILTFLIGLVSMYLVRLMKRDEERKEEASKGTKDTIEVASSK